jgi:hypothetical protein
MCAITGQPAEDVCDGYVQHDDRGRGWKQRDRHRARRLVARPPSGGLPSPRQVAVPARSHRQRARSGARCRRSRTARRRTLRRGCALCNAAGQGRPPPTVSENSSPGLTTTGSKWSLPTGLSPPTSVHPRRSSPPRASSPASTTPDADLRRASTATQRTRLTAQGEHRASHHMGVPNVRPERRPDSRRAGCRTASRCVCKHSRTRDRRQGWFQSGRPRTGASRCRRVEVETGRLTSPKARAAARGGTLASTRVLPADSTMSAWRMSSLIWLPGSSRSGFRPRHADAPGGRRVRADHRRQPGDVAGEHHARSLRLRGRAR